MAPAARAAAESLACAVCATLPAPGKKLRSCERCKQRGLPATYYCSAACQEQGWPAHRAWHKEQKKWFKEHILEAHDDVLHTTAKGQARRAERTGSKFDELLAAAMKLAAEHNFRHAARKYREAIALEPLKPVAYHNLGAALNKAGDIAKAAEMFLQASELCQDGTEMWAEAIACAFILLQLPALAEEPKPDWWHDGALKALSARVVAAAPNSPQTVSMRAVVLSGASAWEAGRRTAAELREAAKLYLRAATLTPVPAEKAQVIDCAARLNKKVEAMAVAEAAARAEEQAAAAAARAEAEAKADEAAAALLAELEVEGAAARSQPSGKSSSKKKVKGKGRR